VRKFRRERKRIVKIAFATEDGQTISQHFGRAPYYVVLTIEDGKVVGREQREKASHGPGEHHHGAHDGAHEHSHDDEPLHNRMAASITDCAAMVVRGMGRPAYESVLQSGVRPIVTTVPSIDEAAAAYVAGTLTDHVERLH
jgi:predicted Fe-Mo cluster-binding NifX family protein